MAATRGVVTPVVAAALLAIAALAQGARAIGVCYGVNMDAAIRPSASDVVQMYRSNGIGNMRIYSADADPGALPALRSSNIGVIMDIGNGNLAAFASNQGAAANWVRKNVKNYPDVNFRYIAVGNEVQQGTEDIVPAMRNVNAALAAEGLSNIKVSTAVRFDVIADSSPPSSGRFAQPYMEDIARFLASTGAPLLANVYPYFAYKGDQGIDLNFALFQPSSTTVHDNGLDYTNLFDAMVDAVRAALDKAGAGGVDVVVSESGWPSADGTGASVDNARTYNQNLIDHAGNGTPRKPGPMEIYVFAMFNENLKDGDPTEKKFGLFDPENKTPVYPINFGGN